MFPSTQSQSNPLLPYNRIELGIGLFAFALALVPGEIFNHTVILEWAALFRWVGVALLGQGLLRDMVILIFHRQVLTSSETRRGIWICLESTLGLALIGLYFLIDALGGHLAAKFEIWQLLIILSFTWLFGYLIRDLILELRRDPHHLNLIFGFSPKKKPR